MKKLYYLMAAALIAGCVSCSDNKKSSRSSDSDSDSDNKTEQTEKSESSDSKNTIKIGESTITGDQSEYLDFSGEDAKLFITKANNYNRDGEDYYRIIAKVPVKVVKTVDISNVYYPTLNFVDENGLMLSDDDFKLGYKTFDDEAEEEFKALMKKELGSTGELTFYSAHDFKADDAEKLMNNILANAKKLKIKDMHFVINEPDVQSQEVSLPGYESMNDDYDDTSFDDVSLDDFSLDADYDFVGDYATEYKKLLDTYTEKLKQAIANGNMTEYQRLNKEYMDKLEKLQKEYMNNF